MTAAETFTLASYFFVLVILAVYGWHRYYLVYLYMRNRDKRAEARAAALQPTPVVTIQLPLYNEMYVADRLIESVCAIDYPQELPRDSGPGRLDRRNPADSGAGGAPVRRAGYRHQVPPPDQPAGLQGGSARSGPAGGAR